MVGLPDLVLMHPGLKRAGFFEVKRYEAKGYRPLDRSTWKPKQLRPEQELFRQDALACGLIYGFGGIREAEQLLVELGLAEDVGNGGIILKARCFQPHVEQRLKASL
jgi:hypothetical protein